MTSKLRHYRNSYYYKLSFHFYILPFKLPAMKLKLYSLLLFRLVTICIVSFLWIKANSANAATSRTEFNNRQDTVPQNDTSLKIFEKVEIEAAFTGGESGWRTYLEQNLNAMI